jgi:RNA chaperone ProQ/FINO-like protein
MTIIEQSDKLPMKMRPVLKLKLGPASAPQLCNASLGAAAPVPTPVPVPKPTPAPPAPPAAKATPPELNEAEIAGRARRAERAAAIAAEKDAKAAVIAKRVALHQRAMKMREILAERFPACFKGCGEPRLPLKVGIHRDIWNTAPSLSHTDIRGALKDYVSDAAYYQVLAEGAVRVDLNGNPAGVVTEQQAKWSAMRAARRS